MITINIKKEVDIIAKELEQRISKTLSNDDRLLIEFGVRYGLSLAGMSLLEFVEDTSSIENWVN